MVPPLRMNVDTLTVLIVHVQWHVLCLIFNHYIMTVHWLCDFLFIKVLGPYVVAPVTYNMTYLYCRGLLLCLCTLILLGAALLAQHKSLFSHTDILWNVRQTSCNYEWARSKRLWCLSSSSLHSVWPNLLYDKNSKGSWRFSACSRHYAVLTRRDCVTQWC